MFIQFTLMFLASFLVLIFPFINHPLMMGLIILVLTILLASGLGLLSVSTWLSYTLILILLGGLLVIFVYVSLLASNENQEPIKMSSLFTLLAILAGFSTLSSSFLVWASLSNSFVPVKATEEDLDWLTLFYSADLGPTTIFLVLYLFLTLIVVVFISKTNTSSLRAT